MTQWDLYKFYTALRLKARFNGRVFVPDLPNWRYWEYAWILSRLPITSGERVLDVGSADSLLPSLMASRFGAAVYAIDPHDYVKIQHTYARLLDVEAHGGKVIVEVHDATRLPYPSGFFDTITCISTIEHIPDDGDCQAFKELMRVLRPGGVMGLTVPYAKEFTTVYVEKDMYGQRYTGVPIFFERQYDQKALETRFLSHPQLKAILQTYVLEWRRHAWYEKVLRECLLDPGLRSLFEAKTKWHETLECGENVVESHNVFLCILKKQA